MNNDLVLQTVDAIRSYLKNVIASSKEPNQVDYFTIVRSPSTDQHDINCFIVVTVETVKDKYLISERQEVNQVALNLFISSIEKFREVAKSKGKGDTFRIAALLS